MRNLLLIGLVVFTPACFPEFEDRPYLVEEPAILAIRSAPAELRPNAQAALEALVVTPNGTLDSAEVEWAFCLSARRAEERTSVTAACLEGRELAVVESSATVLADACARFGPIAPPSEGDQPPLRPTDPDPTGGYFLPVRATVTPEIGSPTTAFGFVRIRCDLAGATRAIFEAFQASYTENVNPEIGELSLDGQARAELAAAPGAKVVLGLAPEPTATEPFVVYSAHDGVLYSREESLRASWHVSAGTLSVASQELAADQVRAGDGFRAILKLPDNVGTVHGWVVLRDQRGGASWASFAIAVE